MSESHRLFQAWLLAERNAANAIRTFFAADIAFTRGTGPSPPPGLAEEAAFRRAQAQDLLRLFVEQTERESAEIRAETRLATLHLHPSEE